VTTDEATGKNVDHRGQDGRRRDHDVVRPDGDPDRDVRPQHRDETEPADPEASESLEHAADAVVGEPLKIAAAGVVVAVPVAGSDAGPTAVSVRSLTSGATALRLLVVPGA